MAMKPWHAARAARDPIEQADVSRKAEALAQSLEQ